jgi:hypothetical protein
VKYVAQVHQLHTVVTVVQMPFFISIFFWLIVYLVIRNACANRALIYTKQEYSVTIIVEYFTQVLANSNALAKAI